MMSNPIIGKDVKIADTAIIHPNVEIGDNTVIEDFCIIGYPAPGEHKGKKLIIGKNSIIRTHSTLYEGSIFGDGLRVGHSTLIREGVRAGVDFQVGSLNDLEGDFTVGDYVRFHSNVHIGKGAKIGNYVWIFPYVVLTNDPIPPSGLMEGVTCEDGSIVCTMSVILPGVTIGMGALVGAYSRVSKDVPPCKIVVGAQGKIVANINKLKHEKSGKSHPWMSFFRRYPEEAQLGIDDLHSKILNKLSEYNE